MKKWSLIDVMRCEYTLRLERDRIFESIRIRLDSEVHGTLYNFMHPWLALFTEFYGKNRDGAIISGEFAGGEINRWQQKKSLWLSYYAPRQQIGLVSVVDPLAPLNDTDQWTIVDRKVDRKLYYVVGINNQIPADREFAWSMTTVFFESAPADWRQKAEVLSESIRTAR